MAIIPMNQTQPARNGTLTEWLNYIGALHVSAIDMGLSRVLPVAHFLGIRKADAYVFTVAGTNGKGSTTSSIAKICEKAGYKTALYQSPHVFLFNERIKINDVCVSDTQIIEALYAVDNARIQCGLSLSFFEATTLAAMLIFKQANCDVWVLEVGLGGRLDVVNIIDADCAVITNIGIDHIDWLGADKDSIGYEKAGILRQGIPCILADANMPASVWAAARQHACAVYGVTQDYFYQSASTNTGITDINHQQTDIKQTWFYSNQSITLALPLPKLALNNVAAAITACLASDLHVTTEAITHAMTEIKLMGRFYQTNWSGSFYKDAIQEQNEDKHSVPVIFDAMHNPDGVRFLLQQLQPVLQKKSINDIHIVFSMLADKDIAQVVMLLQSGLLQLLDIQQKSAKNITWHIAPMQTKRAASMTQLLSAFDQLDHALDTGNVLDFPVQTIKSQSIKSQAIKNKLTDNQHMQQDKQKMLKTINVLTYSCLKDASMAAYRGIQNNKINDRTSLNSLILVCGSFHVIADVAILPD